MLLLYLSHLRLVLVEDTSATWELGLMELLSESLPSTRISPGSGRGGGGGRSCWHSACSTGSFCPIRMTVVWSLHRLS